jgi:hypothetical protein
MRERKGFISWKDAGPRKMMDGIEVAPDRVKVYFNLDLDCLSVRLRYRPSSCAALHPSS